MHYLKLIFFSGRENPKVALSLEESGILSVLVLNQQKSKLDNYEAKMGELGFSFSYLNIDFDIYALYTIRHEGNKVLVSKTSKDLFANCCLLFQKKYTGEDRSIFLDLLRHK
ncbi:MAG: hypothetical protein IPO92_10405 [Saprospiraceae bacterium]|nr:hypothetical protein [Saprospiraceae bacterium]